MLGTPLYPLYLRYLSLWFSGVMGVSIDAFRKQFATQSGRSGGASSAANAGVPFELWGQHGEWKTLDAQKRYMKSDPSRLLAVSHAAMHLPTGLAPDVRTECGSVVAPTLMAGDEEPPEVVGVPKGAFAWS